jgi:DNA polymerase IIIc chi subunit
MAKIIYYKTTSIQLAKSFCSLAEKCYYSKLNTLVLTPELADLRNMDRVLWTYSKKHFIPHATCEDLFSDQQPIYFSTQIENPNKSEVIIFAIPDRDMILSAFSNENNFNISLFQKILFLFDETSSLSYPQLCDIMNTSKLKDLDIDCFNQEENGAWKKL